MAKLVYGTYEIDPDVLPASSINALLHKGLTHYLGNEQASKVTTWKEATEGVTKEQIDAYKAERVAEAIEHLYAGTVGVRASKPRMTTIDALIRSMAKKELVGILETFKLAWPSKDKTVTFPNGDKLTGEEMLARRLGNPDHYARIRKAAEKEMANEEKAANKIKAESPQITLDLIG